MHKKNLFQSVKSFINSREVDTQFTTKELHSEMLGIESVTFWKRDNPFYRTDTYRSYLKRLGFVKRIKNGLWEVIAPIPNWFDSGTANFLLFPSYVFENGKTTRQSVYKGETRSQIELKLEEHFKYYKKEIVMKHEFKVGDKVKIVGKSGYHGFEMGENVEVIYVYKEVLECERNGGGTTVLQQTIDKNDVVLCNEITYKVGDIVKIICNSNEFHRFKLGTLVRTLVRLKQCDSYQPMWKCEYLDSHDYWYVLESSFELAPIDKEKQNVNIPKNKKEIRPSSAKELAKELVGDGKTPNIWFVTIGAYIMVARENFDCNDYELLDGYSDGDTQTFGPFYSYAAACDKYDLIDLDPHDGIGQVFIEDRLNGTVKEKYAEKVIRIDYSFNEHDDSKSFYKK
jgi:DNA-directed RNA polymerase subunit H (RpoH/RPB5)